VTLRSLIRCTFALLVIAALAGCGSDADVLARVGTRTINRGDFLSAAQLLSGRYAGPPDSAKRHLLQDLVNRETMVQGALREGLHRDTTFLDYQRKLTEQMLREHFFGDMGAISAKVSDAEVAELWRWRADESRARVIFTPSELEIRAAASELRRGADFGATADRFNPAGFTPSGGDIGFVPPGMLQNPIDDAVRTGKIGQVQGPIEAPGQGWFLIRVEQRRPRAARAGIEQERPMLVSIIRQRKQREIVLRGLARLSTDYGVRVRRGAAQELIGRIMPYNVRGENPPPLTASESAQILAEWEGGAYTMGDAFQDLSNGQIPRPNFNVMPTVERWLELRAIERTSLIEAFRRQLDKDPDFQRALRERLNDYLLQGYVAREVLAQSTVNDSDVRALYQHAGPAPMRLKQASFLAAMIRDSASAAQLAATARQAGGLREAVMAAGLGSRVRAESVTFPTDNPLYQGMEPGLAPLAIGDYASLPAPGGWLVVQLQGKAMTPQSFETLTADERAQLQNLATQQKRAARLEALTDSLKRVIPFAVYWKRLDHIPWPAPNPAEQPQETEQIPG
jgi:hypothetical protein